MALYPITFTPIFKEKIWGGQKLKTVLNKEISPNKQWGESWEVSAVDDDISKVANGELVGKSLLELLKTYKGDLVGSKVYNQFGDAFPLLIKFLDAQRDLSVQVHPNDQLAKQMYGEAANGKTEMWYVIQADEGAELITGFNEQLTPVSFGEKLTNGKLYPSLNREEPKAGDVFYIPAGRVHTIGEGLLIAEIQQSSDTTFRIYDFDRTDDQGNKRELHVEEAKKALDFTLYDNYRTPYNDLSNARVPLVDEKYFTTNKWNIDRPIIQDYADLDSFKILIGIEGQMDIHFEGKEYAFSKGQVYLIPASIKELEFIPRDTCTFLEVYVH